MAFSLRLVGLTLRQGEYSMTPIPGEFDGSSLDMDPSVNPQLKQVHLSEGYSDYFAVLSPTEALKILGQSHVHSSELPQLQAAVREATIVVAHVFEWETGFG
jgi:hypothetical protein